MSLMYTSILLIWVMYWISYISAQCIPANTCFAGHDESGLWLDTSRKFTCDSSRSVDRWVWYGSLTCNGEPDAGGSTTLTLNGATGATNANAKDLDDSPDLVVGRSSGAYKTDYLQGINCPLLNSASSGCSDYFMIRHWGTRSLEKPYSDMADNCTNKDSLIDNDVVFIPYGCVSQGSGSMQYTCDANGWSYTRYDQAGCTGTVETAQSDDYVVHKCGYKPPLIRSDFGNQPEWWYWYDLLCCPATTPCVPGGETPQPTGPPVASPGSTPQPVTAPSPTPQPATTPVQTPQPVTASPTPQPVTPTQPTYAVPSPTPQPASGSQPSSPTTAAPTSPGTAKPTAPTTAAPTDSSGTAEPTAPTTAAPTSQGTARPTPAPTSQATAVWNGYVFIMGVLLAMFSLF